jgi:riboflavin kinase/FMN adenylyltransferase
LGFPTANLKVADESKLIPKDGVYAVNVEIKGQVWKGMMNIGNNPSITSKNRSIEVHIFDFDTDIYDEDIIVRFIKRIREEISFDNLQALKNQLEKR